MGFIKRTLGTITLAAAAALSSSCDEEDENFKGSPDDAIAEVSTPKQAQKFIDKYIAYKDRSDYSRGANGGNVYSLSLLLDKDKGLCRDGAVAAAAMLKDDGYPSLILSRWPGERGHVIFVYQHPSNRDMNPNTPNWGSAGINSYDYRDPKFTLDQIVAGIDGKFGYSSGGYYSLQDLSLFNLKNGDPTKWVSVDPFIIYLKKMQTGEVMTGTVTPSGNGANVKYSEDFGGSWRKYDLDFNAQQFIERAQINDDWGKDGVNDSEQLLVINSRWPNGVRKEGHQTQKFYNSGMLTDRREIDFEWYPAVSDPLVGIDGNTHLETRYFYGNDAIVDSIQQIETLPDGRNINRYDNDGNGTWDIILGP